MKKKSGKLFFNLILILLLVFVLYRMFRGQSREITTSIHELSAFSLFLILLCSVLYQVTDGIIVTKIMRKHKESFSFREGIEAVFQGCFYRGISFSMGTMAGQMYFLSEKGIQLSQSMSVLTLSYAMQKIGVCLYVTLSFIFNGSFFYKNYSSYISYMWLGYAINLVVVVFLILIAASKKFHHQVNVLLKNFPKSKKIQPIQEKVTAQMDELSEDASLILCDAKLLIHVLLLELIKFSFWYIIPYLGLIGGIHAGGELNPFDLLSVTALINALVGVIPTPSGIMSTEVVFTVLFAVIIGKAEAGAIMILYRFATYILPVLIGILVWLISRRKQDRSGG